MSDDNLPGQQVEGQPANISAGTPSQVEGGQERPSGDIQVIVDRILSAMREEFAELSKRQRQSVKDTVSARVNKEIQRLRSAGINATPEQVEQLITDNEPESQSQPPVSASAPAQAQNIDQLLDPVTKQAMDWLKEDGGDPQQADPLTVEIYQMQAKAGVHLLDDDPEVAELREKSKGKSLYETMRLVDEAIQAKQKRVSKEGSPARIPAMSKGNALNVPDVTQKRSLDIFEEYYQRR